MPVREYYFLILCIPVLFVSMIIGAIIAALIKNTRVYQYIDSHTFYNSRKFYDFLGTEIVKNLIINTPLKSFNSNIKIEKRKYHKEEILDLRHKMTEAEIGHIIGFVFVLLVCIVSCFSGQDKTSVLVLFVLNIIFNFYPVLIQQSNKIRLNRILKNEFW